jgi:hypothetical protein
MLLEHHHCFEIEIEKQRKKMMKKVQRKKKKELRLMKMILGPKRLSK